MQRMCAVKSSYSFESLEINQAKKKTASFLTYHLVWDTGVFFGLTPFCCDFIDYVECSIPLNDIARTNMVIEIGTTLYIFSLDGGPVYLPCLSYHLPSAAIRLLSAQTYHKLYGGHSAVFGDKTATIIDWMSIHIPINYEGGNIPLIYNYACNAR